jgi:hypothetical protein
MCRDVQQTGGGIQPEKHLLQPGGSRILRERRKRGLIGWLRRS